jgi:hypothetical protein
MGGYRAVRHSSRTAAQARAEQRQQPGDQGECRPGSGTGFIEKSESPSTKSPAPSKVTTSTGSPPSS